MLARFRRRAAGVLTLLVSPGLASAQSPPGDAACIAALEAGDRDHAAALCRDGANAGNPVDQYNLALALSEHDPERARDWLQRAAEAGLMQASHRLGNLLLDAGKHPAGLKQLARAARAGLPDAQYDYATALLEQAPEGKQRERVLRWYARAARGGAAAARYNLAALNLRGVFGEPDALAAWAWLQSMHAVDGHSRVTRLANDLFAAMTTAERERARHWLRAVSADPVGAALAERPEAVVAAE